MAAAARSVSPSARSVNSSFTPLFTVQFQHSYYNAAGGKCPDFKVVPTPDCAKRMASLGMLFKDLGAGFVVLIATSRVSALTDYLLSLYSSESPGAGYWSWLSFLLVPANPDFIGFTSLPITTNPMQQNLHLSNMAVQASEDVLTLAGSAGSGPAPQSFYPVTGASLAVSVPQGLTATLADLSGKAVSAAMVASDTATSFDLTNLPYGYYTLGFRNAQGQAAPVPKGYAGPTAWLYVPASPQSLCVLDLLLTQPAQGAGVPSAYPVPVMPAPPDSGSAPASIQPVTLTLPFDARGTYWSYYIVPQTAGQLSEDMAISGSGTSFSKSSEMLPNGDQAVLFTAGTALPLSQVSSYKFTLSGQRQGPNGSRDDIAVNQLPSAPPTPVWPAASGEALAGSSEIYVYV
jgi:hypothetical protein